MEACVASGGNSFMSLPEELQELIVQGALKHVQKDSRVFSRVALVSSHWKAVSTDFLHGLHSLGLVGLKASGIPVSVAQLSALQDLTVADSPRITHIPPSIIEIRSVCQNYGLDLSSLPLEVLHGLRVLRVLNCNAIKCFSSDLKRLHCLSELHVKNCRGLVVLAHRLGEDLQASLRRVHWDSPSLHSLPVDFGLCINLERVFLGSRAILRLPPGALRSLIKLRLLTLKLPNLSSLPDEFQALDSLQAFILQSSALVHLPRSLAGAGATPRLEVLSIDCPNLASVSSTFGRCGYLKQLAISCGINQPFRKNWRMLENMGALELLCLTVGDKPLPASAAAQLASLKELRLMVFDSANLPTSAGAASSNLAQRIGASVGSFIASIPSLESVTCLVQEPRAFPRVIKHSANLHSLIVCFQNDDGTMVVPGAISSGKSIAASWTREASSDCDRLTRRKQAVLKNFTGYSNLNRSDLLSRTSCVQDLCISGGRNLAVPSALPGLALLRRLKLDRVGCPALPWGLGSLTHLTALALKDLAFLLDLPTSLSSLSKLTHLHIVSCKNLNGVQLPAAWSVLEVLHISGCPRVPSPGSSLQAFSRTLRTLLLGCEQMHPSPPQMDALTALTSFTVLSPPLGICEHTTALPASLGLLPSLRRIRCTCPGLGDVPASLSALTALQSLEVKLGSRVLCVPNPQRLRWLPPQQASELQAKALELSRRTVLAPTSWMPTSGQCLSNLKTLVLSNFPGLRLPAAIGELQALASLEIVDCKFLQSIPQAVALLPQLLSLKLLRCRSLKRIANSQEGTAAGSGSPFPALVEALAEACHQLQKPRGGRLGAAQLQVVPSVSLSGVKRLRNGKKVTAR